MTDFAGYSLDDVPACVVVTQDDGTIVGLNAEWTAEFDAPIGASIFDLVSRAGKIFLQTHILPTLFKDGRIDEIYLKLRHSNQMEEPVLLNARRSFIAGETSIIWSIFIAKERRKMEAELLRRKDHAEDMAKTIEQTAKELARSNDLLSVFSRMVAHDLKAPIGHINVLSELLSTKVNHITDPKTLEYIKLLRDNSRSTIRLVDDLLRYSLMGEKHGDFKNIDIEPFLNEVFELSAAPRSFQLSYLGDIKRINTLYVPIELILRNLINNAIKHRERDDGAIKVSIFDRGENFEIIVEDDGPGIAPEYHDMIFGQFNEPPKASGPLGTGLGLYMVKNTIDAYGGSIRVISDTDQGAQFVISWPKEEALKRFVHASD